MNQIGRVATETALSIPEILSLIFPELPPGTQAACACVCKKWSELALDELWRDLDDVYPLLKLVIDNDSFYGERRKMSDEIRGLIRNADWLRFRKYATRVVSIDFDEDGDLEYPPSEAGITFLCFHHRFGTCFTPTARKLQWRMTSKDGATLMIPFISENLEELTMEIGSESECAIELFLGLVHRTPTLKKLRIESDETLSEAAASFSRWIRTCFGLVEVHIPRSWHTSTIVAAFESLPQLIEFGHQWTNPPDDDIGGGISVAINGGCFRSLRRLGWRSNIKHAEDLLKQTSRQLQALTFDCRGQSSQGEVVEFLTIAVNCCPELDSLCLKLAEIPGALGPGILRPLLACKTLTKLRIHSSSIFNLSTPDLEKLGDAWPKMVELVLCPDPDEIEDNRGTAISALLHVAAAFPRLRVLGLYLDRLEPPGSAGDLLPECQFRCLRELDVGTSLVPGTGPVPVGLYLASLCNVGTRPSIRAGISDVRFGDGLYHESETRLDWGIVEDLIHGTMGIKEAFVRRLSSR